MCNRTHKMTYLLKKHDKSYTGTMLELEGVFTSGVNEEVVTKNLQVQSLAYLGVFKKLHEKIQKMEDNDERLEQTLPKSTDGVMEGFIQISVECKSVAA